MVFCVSSCTCAKYLYLSSDTVSSTDPKFTRGSMHSSHSPFRCQRCHLWCSPWRNYLRLFPWPGFLAIETRKNIESAGPDLCCFLGSSCLSLLSHYWALQKEIHLPRCSSLFQLLPTPAWFSARTKIGLEEEGQVPKTLPCYARHAMLGRLPRGLGPCTLIPARQVRPKWQWHTFHPAHLPVVKGKTDCRLTSGPSSAGVCVHFLRVLSWVCWCEVGREGLLNTWHCKPEIRFTYCLAFNLIH